MTPSNQKKSKSKLKYFIQTFGCQMNYSDTERVSAILEKAGYEKAKIMEEIDLYILNTCSIKQKGEDRVFGMIKNIYGYKKANPRLLIGLTGCMVRKSSSRNSSWEKKDDLLKTSKYLDFVFKITDTHKLPEILAEAEPLLELPELEEENLNDYLKISPQYSQKFQATVPIQIGCDKYCTYCIVPYARGREQSRPPQDILDECRKLVENGCKEITLVGQTVNSYGLSALDKKNPIFGDYHLGKITNTPFVQLLESLDALSAFGLSRIRYMSPHPRHLDDQLIEAHGRLKTICNHLHLPIQSGDDQMLAKMNRKHTVEQYREKVRKLKEKVPDMVITTDIIVGFSGETEEQFENSLKFFEEMRWDQIFISRYSERSGTLAEKHFPDDVPKDAKATRWHKMNNLLKIISKEKNKAFEGKTLEVLVEKVNSLTGECEGRSREFKLVQFPGQPDLIGQLVDVKIIKAFDWLLKGELLQ